MTIKISQLANLTVIQANTIVPVVSNITGTLTTVQANVQQLQTYILGTIPTDIVTLQTNAATQSDLIIGINANVTAANIGMTGYVDAVTTNWTANALAQQTILNTLLANAATQSDLIIAIDANVASANIGMIGYVNNSTTTANVGMIGYVDRGNTIVTAGIVTANVGMKGYVDNQTYSNVQALAFFITGLPAYEGNVNRLTITNTAISSSTTTGALTVAGGVGISGNVFAGNIFASNISANVNGYSIGYKDLPQITTSNVTLSADDGGKHYYVNSLGTHYYTVPSNANVSLPIGTTVVIINRTTGNIIANTQAEVSLYRAGNVTADNRTITGYGIATLIKVESNVWMINGTGIV